MATDPVPPDLEPVDPGPVDQGAVDQGAVQAGDTDPVFGAEHTVPSVAPPPFHDLVRDEKLREHAARFTSIDDLVRANLDSRQKLSKAIVPPGRDASIDDLAAFNRALGVPDTSDGYHWPDPQGGLPLSEEQRAVRGEWSDFFLENRFSKPQAEGAMAKVAEIEQRRAQAQLQADQSFATQQDAALQSDWGPAYDRNFELANRAASELFGADLETVRHLETKDGRFVMDNAVMLKAFARMGTEMGEGSLGGAFLEGDRATLEEQADQIRKQKHEALAKGDNATADRLLQQEQEIYRKRGSQAVINATGRGV